MLTIRERAHRSEDMQLKSLIATEHLVVYLVHSVTNPNPNPKTTLLQYR
jgi:hypothetical protein